MKNITLIHQLLHRLLNVKEANISTSSNPSKAKSHFQTAQHNQVFVQKCFDEFYLARIWLWAIPVYRSVFSPDQILDLLHEFVAFIANEKQVGLVEQEEELTFKFIFDLFAGWLEIHAFEKRGSDFSP